MATTYPTTADALSNPNPADPLSSVSVPHATQHTNANDAIEALEAKLGTGTGAPAANTVLGGTGAGATTYRQITGTDVAPSAAIPYSKLALANSITTTDISDATIVNADLALKTIRGGIDGVNGRIANGTLVNADLAPLTIRGAIDGAAGRIVPGSIYGADIASGQIGDVHINPNTIAGSKIQSETITTTQILNGTIANADIGAQVIRGGIDGGAGRIAPATIYGSDIAAEQITNREIADGTVRTNEIQAGAISVLTSNVSSNAFGALNASGWVSDAANTRCHIDLAFPAMVIATFTGTFDIDASAGVYGRFGIVRSGATASPNWFIRAYFAAPGRVVPLTVQYMEALPAGSHNIDFMMLAETAGFTLVASTVTYRYMTVMAFYR